MKALHRCSRLRGKGIGKDIVLRCPEQVLARPVDLMRQFQLEQLPALLRVEENPKGKTTRHWL